MRRVLGSNDGAVGPPTITVGRPGGASSDVAQFGRSRRRVRRRQADGCDARGEFWTGEVLVFCARKAQVDACVVALRNTAGVRVAGMHGDMRQSDRAAALRAFRKGETHVLVATDVAARGLDVPSVRTVVSLHPPGDIESHVHRTAGRDARGTKTARVHAGGGSDGSARFCRTWCSTCSARAEGAAAARNRQGRRRRAPAGVGKGWARERTRGGGVGIGFDGGGGHAEMDELTRRYDAGRRARPPRLEPTPAPPRRRRRHRQRRTAQPSRPEVRPVDGRRAGSRERRGGRAPEAGWSVPPPTAPPPPMQSPPPAPAADDPAILAAQRPPSRRGSTRFAADTSTERLSSAASSSAVSDTRRRTTRAHWRAPGVGRSRLALRAAGAAGRSTARSRRRRASRRRRRAACPALGGSTADDRPARRRGGCRADGQGEGFRDEQPRPSDERGFFIGDFPGGASVGGYEPRGGGGRTGRGGGDRLEDHRAGQRERARGRVMCGGPTATKGHFRLKLGKVSIGGAVNSASAPPPLNRTSPEPPFSAASPRPP